MRGLVLPPCTGWGLPPCRYRPASSPPPGTVPGGLRLRGSVGASPIALGAPSPGVWRVHPTTLGLGCFPSPPGGRWGATPVTYTQGGAFPMDQEDPVPWGQRVASQCRSMGCSPTGAIRVHPPRVGVVQSLQGSVGCITWAEGCLWGPFLSCLCFAAPRAPTWRARISVTFCDMRWIRSYVCVTVSQRSLALGYGQEGWQSHKSPSSSLPPPPACMQQTDKIRQHETSGCFFLCFFCCFFFFAPPHPIIRK